VFDDGQRISPEIDDSAWVYLAAHQRGRVDTSSPFARLLTDVCERAGFIVYPSVSADAQDEDRLPLWVDAVKHAELCIIDLGAASAAAGAELATACCSGRPVIALRAHDEPVPRVLASLVEHHPTTRAVVFSDEQDCVDQLLALLTDPCWQRLVRAATVCEPF
jgi:hypothetical protein